MQNLQKLTKIVALLICFLLSVEQTTFAQVAGQLDISSRIAALHQNITSNKFRPLHLRSLSYNEANNDFKLLLDKGTSKDPKIQEQEEASQKVFTYFLTGVSLPNDKFWVNLRPDQPENIIDPLLARTDIGKVLLEADLQLKKDTALATSPETQEGRIYWEKLYKKAGQLFGSENVSIPTLIRPWIVPDEVIIRETADNAYIYKASLKVMLEQDYLKDSTVYRFDDQRSKQLNDYASSLVRELIIPKLNKEINTSQKYAPLRQVYYSLIIAQWFKQRFYGKNGLYARLINRQDLAKITAKEPYAANTYFEAYQKSFKEGEYNFKQSVPSMFGQAVRSYFSGGFAMGEIIPAAGKAIALPGGGQATSIIANSGRAPEVLGGGTLLNVNVNSQGAITVPKQTSQGRLPEGLVGAMYEEEGSMDTEEQAFFNELRTRFAGIFKQYQRKFGKIESDHYIWGYVTSYLEKRRQSNDTQLIRKVLAPLKNAGVSEAEINEISQRIILVRVNESRLKVEKKYLGGLIVMHGGTLKVLFPRNRIEDLVNSSTPANERAEILGDMLHEIVEVGLIEKGHSAKEAHRIALEARSRFIKAGAQASALYVGQVRSINTIVLFEDSFPKQVKTSLEILGIKESHLAEMQNKELKALIADIWSSLKEHAPPLMLDAMNALLTENNIRDYKEQFGHFDSRDLTLILQRIHFLSVSSQHFSKTIEGLKALTLSEFITKNGVNFAFRMSVLTNAGFNGAAWDVEPDAATLRMLEEGRYAEVARRLSAVNVQNGINNGVVKAASVYFNINPFNVCFNTMIEKIGTNPLPERLKADEIQAMVKDVRQDFIRVLSLVLYLQDYLKGYKKGEHIIGLLGRGSEGLALLVNKGKTQLVMKIGVKSDGSPDMGAAEQTAKAIEKLSEGKSLVKNRSVEWVNLPELNNTYFVETNEYVDGVSLYQIVNHSQLYGGLNVALRMLVEFLDLEDYLQVKGFYNHDMFNIMGNILVKPDGTIALVDYGNIYSFENIADEIQKVEKGSFTEADRKAVINFYKIRQKEKASKVAAKIILGDIDDSLFEAFLADDQEAADELLDLFEARFGKGHRILAKKIFLALKDLVLDPDIAFSDAINEIKKITSEAGVNFSKARLDGLVGAMYEDNSAGSSSMMGKIMEGIRHRRALRMLGLTEQQFQEQLAKENTVRQGYEVIGGVNNPDGYQWLMPLTGFGQMAYLPNKMIYSPFQDVNLSLHFARFLNAMIAEHFKSRKKIKILVVGAGSGIDSLAAYFQAKQMGQEVILDAIDINPAAVENTTYNFDWLYGKLPAGINIKKVEAGSAQDPDKEFKELGNDYDLVIFHAPNSIDTASRNPAIEMNKNELLRLLKNMQSRLAQGGAIVLNAQDKIIGQGLITGASLQITDFYEADYRRSLDPDQDFGAERRKFFYLTHLPARHRVDTDYSLVSSPLVNPGMQWTKSVEALDPSIVVPLSDQTTYKVNPAVCLAVMAFNNTPGENFGKRFVAHLLPTGHLSNTAESRPGLLEQYLKEKLSALSGSGWQVQIISSEQGGDSFSHWVISPALVEGYLVNRNKIPRQNVAIHDKHSKKAIGFDYRGVVRVLSETDHVLDEIPLADAQSAFAVALSDQGESIADAGTILENIPALQQEAVKGMIARRMAELYYEANFAYTPDAASMDMQTAIEQEFLNTHQVFFSVSAGKIIGFTSFYFVETDGKWKIDDPVVAKIPQAQDIASRLVDATIEKGIFTTESKYGKIFLFYVNPTHKTTVFYLGDQQAAGYFARRGKTSPERKPGWWLEASEAPDHTIHVQIHRDGSDSSGKTAPDPSKPQAQAVPAQAGSPFNGDPQAWQNVPLLLDLGDNYQLRLIDSGAQLGINKSAGLIFRFQTKDGVNIGQLGLLFDQGTGLWRIAPPVGVNVETAHRGQGLGRRAVAALLPYLKAIGSSTTNDQSEYLAFAGEWNGTSPDAERMWQSLGAVRFTAPVNPIFNNAEKGSDAYALTYQGTAPGGIDLRLLPIAIQPVAGQMPLLPANSTTGREWQLIQNMLDAGITPSAERMKDYLLKAGDSEMDAEISNALFCIAGLLRLEEDGNTATDPNLKAFLALLEAGKPKQEFIAALNSIHFAAKEPRIN